MKKYCLFICLTCLLISNIVAQDIAFVANETSDLLLKNSSKRGGIITNLVNGDIIVLRNSKKEYFIDRFNSDFDILSSVAFDRKKEENIQAVIEKDNGVTIIIKETIDKQEFQFKLVSYDIDSNEIVEQQFFRDFKKEGKNKFGLITTILGDSRHSNYFIKSPNNQFIAFIRDIVDIKTQAYEVIVYDQDFNEVYTQGYKGDLEDYYLLRDFLITDDASVFLAGKLYKNGKKEKEKDQANYSYIIHQLTKEASIDKTVDVAEQHFINDVLLAQNKEKVYLSGLYSEKDTEYVKGIVSYVFNDTIENVEGQFETFPEEVFYDVYSENRADRLISKESELRFYHINHLLVDDLGHLYVTAEQHWTKSQHNPGITNQYEQNHFYGNIMTLKLNEQGKLLWARNIFKKEYYSDYFAVVAKNELHLFLNGGKELLERSNGRTKIGKAGAFLGSNLYDISFASDTGDYTFTALKENTLRTFHTLSRGKWNGKRFLSGGFWKKRGSMLSIEIDD